MDLGDCSYTNIERSYRILSDRTRNVVCCVFRVVSNLSFMHPQFGVLSTCLITFRFITSIFILIKYVY